MSVYQGICEHCGIVEIIKPMAEAFPTEHGCGGKLTRLFAPVPVHYNVGDFDNLRKRVGPERFAKFEAKRKQILDATPRGGVDALED